METLRESLEQCEKTNDWEHKMVVMRRLESVLVTGLKDAEEHLWKLFVELPNVHPEGDGGVLLDKCREIAKTNEGRSRAFLLMALRNGSLSEDLRYLLFNDPDIVENVFKEWALVLDPANIADIICALEFIGDCPLPDATVSFDDINFWNIVAPLPKMEVADELATVYTVWLSNLRKAREDLLDSPKNYDASMAIFNGLVDIMSSGLRKDVTGKDCAAMLLMTTKVTFPNETFPEFFGKTANAEAAAKVEPKEVFSRWTKHFIVNEIPRTTLDLLLANFETNRKRYNIKMAFLFQKEMRFGLRDIIQTIQYAEFNFTAPPPKPVVKFEPKPKPKPKPVEPKKVEPAPEPKKAEPAPEPKKVETTPSPKKVESSVVERLASTPEDVNELHITSKKKGKKIVRKTSLLSSSPKAVLSSSPGADSSSVSTPRTPTCSSPLVVLAPVPISTRKIPELVIAGSQVDIPQEEEYYFDDDTESLDEDPVVISSFTNGFHFPEPVTGSSTKRSASTAKLSSVFNASKTDSPVPPNAEDEDSFVPIIVNLKNSVQKTPTIILTAPPEEDEDAVEEQSLLSEQALASTPERKDESELSIAVSPIQNDAGLDEDEVILSDDELGVPVLSEKQIRAMEDERRRTLLASMPVEERTAWKVRNCFGDSASYIADYALAVSVENEVLAATIDRAKKRVGPVIAKCRKVLKNRPEEPGMHLLRASEALSALPIPGNVMCAGCFMPFDDFIQIITQRYCNYTCRNYCPVCHVHDKSLIPSRVIFKWDFAEYSVCREAKEAVDTHYATPLFFLHDFPVEIVRTKMQDVVALRQKLLQFVPFISSCKMIDLGKMAELERMYFFNSADKFSLKDLVDIKNGELTPYLQYLIRVLEKHVCEDCELCLMKGHVCELCNGRQGGLLFPFFPEEELMECSECRTLVHPRCVHKYCGGRFGPADCPKCQRIARVKKSRGKTGF